MSASATCPACDGAGKVWRPPWVDEDQDTWVSNSAGPWACETCGGQGVLHTIEPPDRFQGSYEITKLVVDFPRLEALAAPEERRASPRFCGKCLGPTPCNCF